MEKIQSDIDKIQAKVEEVKQKHSTILSSAQTDDSKFLFWLFENWLWIVFTTTIAIRSLNFII